MTVNRGPGLFPMQELARYKLCTNGHLFQSTSFYHETRSSNSQAHDSLYLGNAAITGQLVIHQLEVVKAFLSTIMAGVHDTSIALRNLINDDIIRR